jgi:hypothetical protein
MRLIEIIKLIIVNKDMIIEIIELIRELFPSGELLDPDMPSDGIVVKPLDAATLDAALAGRSDTVVEIIRYLMEHQEEAIELYLLLVKLVRGE